MTIGEMPLSTVSKRRRITLKEESLAENKALGLEGVQEQMDTIFAILRQHGINSRLWMEEVFAVSGANNWNLPPDFEKFLPWNLSPAAKERLSKDCTFVYGNAQFLQTNDGTVYHLCNNGTRIKVNFGDMTGDEFEQLIGAR